MPDCLCGRNTWTGSLGSANVRPTPETGKAPMAFTKADIQQSANNLAQQFPASHTGSIGLLLLAMSEYLDDAAPAELYRDAVFDGFDDKRVDFLHIDLSAGVAYIAQCYESVQWTKPNPPATKAAELTSAIAWMLDADLSKIARPELRQKAEELRDALSSGEITSVEAIYIHNSPRNKDVEDEIDTVGNALRERLMRYSPSDLSPSGSARQLSIDDILGLMNARDSLIRIEDQITISVLSVTKELSSPRWTAVLASVEASQLVALSKRYGDPLFGPNIRGFLGSRTSSRNINSQIANTALSAGSDFFVYNNGVSMITKKLSLLPDGSVVCDGLAVINGAQTLGSLETASTKLGASLDGVTVPIRIVSTTDESLIRDIVRYNNTQNPIKPWEMRVLDPIQQRLEREFKEEYDLVYQFRRSNHRRQGDHVLYEKVALWAWAFIGNPDQAHRNGPEFFADDRNHSRVFNQSTRSGWLLFVNRLAEAIGAYKDELKAAVTAGSATDTVNDLYSYFQIGAMTYVALDLCAVCLGELFELPANDRFRFKLLANLETDRTAAILSLLPLVKFALAPLPRELSGKSAYQSLRTTAGVDDLRRALRSTVAGFRALPNANLDDLRTGVEVV